MTAFAGGRQGFQSTTIDFTRSFTLSGSPQGWSVEIVSRVDGSLSARRYGTATLASFVGIVGQYDIPNGGFADGENRRISMTESGRYSLPDGRYVVKGYFLADVVGVGTPPGPSGAAEGAFSISLEATSLAVPEPGGAVLAAIGSTGLMLVVASRRWRRPWTM